MKYLTNLDLNKNELQNVVIQNLAAPPSSPRVGQIYYNTTDKILYNWDGTTWKAVGADIPIATDDILGGVKIGSGLTITNEGVLSADVTTTLLNGKLSLTGGTMSGAIAMGNNKITGLATPTANTDASTKGYVDGQISALGTVFNFKGTKESVSQLPLSGNKQGDVWLVSADSSEYVWTLSTASGTIDGWEKLGITVDLSGYMKYTDGSTTTPKMDGTATVGVEQKYARGDHIHPTDDTRAPLNSPTFTGTPQLTTTPTSGDNSHKLADTAFVAAAVAAKSEVKTTTGTISTSATSAQVSFTGTLINAYATMGGDEVGLDKTIAANSVTFSVASAPSSAVTCVVVYK